VNQYTYNPNAIEEYNLGYEQALADYRDKTETLVMSTSRAYCNGYRAGIEEARRVEAQAQNMGTAAPK
jgi:hypothetical protein